MLCQYCNQEESDYRFYIHFGAEANEVHLCAGCAEKLSTQFFYHMRQMIPNFGFDGERTGSSLPFGSFPFAKGVDRKLGEDPFPLDAGEDIRMRRRLNELRARLADAVHREDYEHAARLRDEISTAESGAGRPNK